MHPKGRQNSTLGDLTGTPVTHDDHQGDDHRPLGLVSCIVGLNDFGWEVAAAVLLVNFNQG